MLDCFLEAMYSTHKKEEAKEKLAASLDELPDDVLHQIVSGEEKLAYSDENGEWLNKFKGTELFPQAYELAQQELKLDLADKAINKQEREFTDQVRDEYNCARDDLRVKRKMLTLQLAGLEEDVDTVTEAAGDATEAAGGDREAVEDKVEDIAEETLAKAASSMRKSAKSWIANYERLAEEYEEAAARSLNSGIMDPSVVAKVGDGLVRKEVKELRNMANHVDANPGQFRRNRAVGGAMLGGAVGGVGGLIASGRALGKVSPLKSSLVGAGVGAGLGALLGGVPTPSGERPRALAASLEAANKSMSDEDRKQLASKAMFNVIRSNMADLGTKTAAPNKDKGMQLSDISKATRDAGILRGGLGGGALAGAAGAALGGKKGALIGGLLGAGAGGTIGGVKGHKRGKRAEGDIVTIHSKGQHARRAAERLSSIAQRQASHIQRQNLTMRGLVNHIRSMQAGQPKTASIEKEAIGGALLKAVGGAASKIGRTATQGAKTTSNAFKYRGVKPGLQQAGKSLKTFAVKHPAVAAGTAGTAGYAMG